MPNIPQRGLTIETVGSLPIPGNSGVLYRGPQPDEAGMLTLAKSFYPKLSTIFKVNKDEDSTPLAWEAALFPGSVMQAPDPKDVVVNPDVLKYPIMTSPIPAKDGGPPLWAIPRTISWAAMIASNVAQTLLSGQDAFIHCTRGRNRTGLVIGAFKILYCGWSVKRTEKHMEETGFTSLGRFPDWDTIETFLKPMAIAREALVANTPGWQASDSSDAFDLEEEMETE